MDGRQRIGVFAAALWWGSLSAIGFLAVPLLFKHLPSAALAGQTAARLFSAQTWVALGCGMLLLIISRPKHAPARMDWAQGALIFVVLGMMLALLVEFAVAPRIVARENLRLWHGAGSAMYALQWLCAGVVLWKVAAAREPAPGREDSLSPGDPS